MLSPLKILRLTAVITFISSLALLASFLLRRSESASAVFLGYSGQRWALIGVAAVLAAGTFLLTIGAWRRSTQQSWVEKIIQWLDRPGRFAGTVALSVSIIIFGALFLIYSSLSLEAPFYAYAHALAPLITWLGVMGVVTLTCLVLWRFGWRVLSVGVFLLPLALSLAGVQVFFDVARHPRDLFSSDIYHTYLDGERLARGENAYERVLEGDMLRNEKYPTYLPLFYLLSAGVGRLGVQYFQDWLILWRLVYLLAYIATGLLLYGIFHRAGEKLLAVFAMLFWLFNRWTLGLAYSADLDLIPIFLVAASFLQLRAALRQGNPNFRLLFLSGLLYGLSLALKHLAVFLLPLYLVVAWVASPARRGRSAFLVALGAAAIPLLVSLPFLVWHAEGLLKSVLFSATRLADAGFETYSLDVFYGWKGVTARLPMLALLLVVYFAAARRPQIAAVWGLIVMIVFTFFNPVLYGEYLAWLIPFIPLAVLDAFSNRKS